MLIHPVFHPPLRVLFSFLGEAALLKGEPISTRGILFFRRVRRTKSMRSCALTHYTHIESRPERILESPSA